jgi:hypothetical protein
MDASWLNRADFLRRLRLLAICRANALRLLAGVASTNSRPTDWGMPKVLFPWAAAAIAAHCAADFAGMMTSCFLMV